MTDHLQGRGLVTLETDRPIWDHFFMVTPLVLVGTTEPDGSPDLAPKHMVTPLGWENYIAFVCTPEHGTYQNAKRTGVFTMSFLRPDEVVAASLAAAPRCDDGIEQPSMDLMKTFSGGTVDAPLVEGAYLYLECELHDTWDGFGRNSVIAGRIVGAHIDQAALRRADRGDDEVLAEDPLLVYLPPGRFASIRETQAFPFHKGMRR